MEEITEDHISTYIMGELQETEYTPFLDPRFKLKLVKSEQDKLNCWGLINIQHREEKGSKYIPTGIGTHIYEKMSFWNTSRVKTTWDNISLRGYSPLYHEYSEFHFNKTKP